MVSRAPRPVGEIVTVKLLRAGARPGAPQARGARPERVRVRGGDASRGSAYFFRRVDGLRRDADLVGRRYLREHRIRVSRMHSTVAAQERTRARGQYIYILRETCLFCRRDPNRREVLRSAEIECVGGATVYAVSARPRGTIPAHGGVRAGPPRRRSGAIFPGQALPRRDRADELVTRRAAHHEAPQVKIVLRAFRTEPLRATRRRGPIRHRVAGRRAPSPSKLCKPVAQGMRTPRGRPRRRRRRSSTRPGRRRRRPAAPAPQTPELHASRRRRRRPDVSVDVRDGAEGAGARPDAADSDSRPS